MTENEPLTFPPIGYMQTCFEEKFGVPRQSLMVTEAIGILKLNPDPQFKEALKCLEEFSHVWLVFVFHEHAAQEWRPLVTTPRVESGRIGVFASRSPHRPNPIGLSAVKLEKINYEAKGGIEIAFSGVDLLNGTPILDIKPYLPYVDSVSGATGGWASQEIPRYKVTFSEKALATIQANTLKTAAFHRGDFKRLIEQLVELDPRPISQRKAMPIENPENEGMKFAFRVLGFDVKWEIRALGILVIGLDQLS